MCASISVHKRAQLAYRAAIQAHLCPAIAIAHVVGQNRSIRTTENDHPSHFLPISSSFLLHHNTIIQTSIQASAFQTLFTKSTYSRSHFECGHPVVKTFSNLLNS
jgi:hypothetical protein